MPNAAPPPPPLPNKPLDYAAANSPYAACPKCGSFGATAVNFTWWGGVLGPKMFTHVKCPGCGYAYNGKTGKSNTTAITIYTVVGSLVGVIIVLIFMWGI